MSPRLTGWMLRGRLAVPAVALAVLAHALLAGETAAAGEAPGATAFRKEIQPILQEFCYDCHGNGESKGHVAWDGFKSDDALLRDHDLWWKALKNLRGSLMPPPRKPQPTPEQKEQIAKWIKSAVFESDPQNPDPGRVTVRRVNRVEYRNTIRDLLGVDFNTEPELPPDDSGYGFDNIGDVLTLPPMLLEKYLAAAKTVVGKAVPTAQGVPAEKLVTGRSFRGAEGTSFGRTNRGPASATALSMSYYEPASISNTFKAAHAGSYQVVLDLTANERYVEGQFDYNKCRLVFKADGQELLSKEFTREGGRALHYEFKRDWKAGDHELTFELQPLTPDQKQVRSLTMRVDSVTVRGPLEKSYWVRPKNYERFFGKEAPKSAYDLSGVRPSPGAATLGRESALELSNKLDGAELAVAEDGHTPLNRYKSPSARRKYAREILEPFVRKAYRRPAETPTLDRLVALAENTYRQPGKTFEAGIAQAMVAVLASPRFLFREEGIAASASGTSYPLVDEYALASRLSYFLWSSMPDDQLFRLAGEKRLRENLAAQVKRMMADARFEDFIRNFTGQWLQTRDIETVSIDARQVLGREAAVDRNLDSRRARFRELRDKSEETLTPEEKKELADLRATLFRRFGSPPRAELTGDLRRAMRQETEKTFDYVIRQDRSLLELIDSDYTFLNERLARHYGLTNLNVTGDEMRRVTLPPDSPRGGILTHGSVLAVTSNPTRTSPVKRGLFILDNILGLPPAPPPPNIPPLEDAAKDFKGREPTLRETLELHRAKPLCSSCHNRMDPLGLAFENFNAMGMWREK